jgi:ketosteroid isomerase-like protein
MDAQQNKQLVMEGYRRFQSHDIAGVLELFHDDVEWEGPEVECVPFAGCYHGKPEVLRYFQSLDDAQEATRFEPTAFIAEDDRVVVTGNASWHVKSTGRDYDSPWVHVFTLRDGKVSRFEQYVNTAATEHAFRPQQAGETAQPELRH